MTDSKQQIVNSRKRLAAGLFLASSFIFLLASSAFAGTPLDQQVITNGDFELCPPGAFTATNAPTDFTFGPGGAGNPLMECRTDGVIGGFPQMPAALGGGVNTGHLAVYASNAAAANSTFSFIFSNSVPAKAGDTVTMSTFYRFAGFAGTAADYAEIKIEFEDAAGVKTTVTPPLGGTNIFPHPFIVGQTVVSGAGGGSDNLSFSGVAPAGTVLARAVLVMVRNIGGTGQIFFDSLKFNTQGAFGLTIATNREYVQKGQAFVVSGVIQNNTAVPVGNVQVVGKIPPGLRFIPGSGTVNGNKVYEQGGSIVLNMGQVFYGVPGKFAFVLAPVSGAKIGDSYEIDLTARDSSNGQFLTGSNRLVIRVWPDPFFDLGTIIGKVFDDKNENGVQDKDEEGIPMVRLVTEQGIVVTTDEDGKYHIPAVSPGRHIVKIDRHTLPDGTKFVTEESYLTKITEGLLAKVSFAVKLPESAEVPQLKDKVKFRVVPEDDTATPELSISMENPMVYVAHEQMKTPIRFLMSTNYSALIHHWKIEVRNELGQVVWTGIGEGVLPGEVVWDGRDNQGKLLQGDEVYSYRLMVTDPSGREDWTDLRLFRTISMKVGEESFPGIDLPTTGYFKMARYGKKDIAHNSYHAVKVVGKVLKNPEQVNLQINDESVVVNKDKSFVHDVYLPSGQSDVMLQTTNEEGDQFSYAETVNLKSTSALVAGLAEGSMGFNGTNGDKATAAHAHELNAFDPYGRVALYSRIRWKDKLRVTTSFDSTKQSYGVLFTNKNPFSIYQTYGDNSSLNYEAYDTQDNFFIMAESDKSFLRWGSYNTGFDDFELAQYNRTLSGLKVHYESPKTTVYGEPKADLTGFQATAKQMPDHVEFRSTAGSLYYLRNINVIEGSEKIKVQVRDEVTNMVLQEKDLFSGVDYEVNYSEGRILLNKPLSSIVDTDTTIHNLILGGNEVFLVVDYEYEPARGSFVDGVEGTTRGLKGHIGFGDKLNIRLGGLYVEDKTIQTENPAKIRGFSGELKALFNTRIRAEVAQQNGLMMDNEYSNNGGLSFYDTSLAKPNDYTDNPLYNYTYPGNLYGGNDGNMRETSCLLKGETKPFKHFDLSGYYQAVGPFFGNSGPIDQRGTRKYGLESQYHLTSNWALKFRYDNQNAVQAKQPIVPPSTYTTPFYLDAQRIESFDFQSLYHRGQWSMTNEYQHQELKRPTDANMNTFDQLIDYYGAMENAIGTKIAYKINDRVTPYVRGQVGMGSGQNHQVGAGMNVQLTKQTSGFVEETVGNIGDGTRFGFENRVSEDTTVYSTFSEENVRSLQDRIFRSSIGTATDLTDRHRIYTERQLTNYRSGEMFSDIAGHRVNWTEGFYTDTRFERSDVYESGNSINRNVGSIQLGYNWKKKLTTLNNFEIRSDRGTLRVLQFVYRNGTSWKINDNLTHKTRLEFADTRDGSMRETLGRFLEFGTGFAYRPLASDRLNMLFNYTYLQNLPLDIQYMTLYAPDPTYNFGVQSEERSHTASAEGIFDVNRWFAIVQKGAIKRGWMDTPETDPVAIFQTLWVSRINFHVTRKWDFGVEYRLLFQREALDTNNQGFLIELDREIMEHIRFGVGFNFTDFSDDLVHQQSYNSRGFFGRMTGKF